MLKPLHRINVFASLSSAFIIHHGCITLENSYITSFAANEIESLGYSRLMPISPANIFECDSNLTSCIPIEQEVGPCIARGGNL